MGINSLLENIAGAWVYETMREFISRTKIITFFSAKDDEFRSPARNLREKKARIAAQSKIRENPTREKNGREN